MSPVVGGQRGHRSAWCNAEGARGEGPAQGPVLGPLSLSSKGPSEHGVISRGEAGLQGVWSSLERRSGPGAPLLGGKGLFLALQGCDQFPNICS